MKNIIFIILINLLLHTCVPANLDKDKIINCIEKNDFQGLNKFKPLIKDKLINLFGYGTNLDFTHKNTNLLVYSFKKNCSLDIVKFLVEIAKITNLNACGHNFNLGGIRVAIAFSNPEVLDYLLKKFPNEFYKTLNYEKLIIKQLAKFTYNKEAKRYKNEDLFWENIFRIPKYLKHKQRCEYLYYNKVENAHYIFNLNHRYTNKKKGISIKINLNIPIEILIPKILHFEYKKIGKHYYCGTKIQKYKNLILSSFDFIYSKSKCKKTLTTYYILSNIFYNRTWFIKECLFKQENNLKINSKNIDNKLKVYYYCSSEMFCNRNDFFKYMVSYSIPNIKTIILKNNDEEKEIDQYCQLDKKKSLKYDFYFYDVFFGLLYFELYEIAEDLIIRYLPFLESYNKLLNAFQEIIYDSNIENLKERIFIKDFIEKDSPILHNMIAMCKKQILKKSYFIREDYSKVETDENFTNPRKFIIHCFKIKYLYQILNRLCNSNLYCSKKNIESFILRIKNNNIDCGVCQNNKLLLVEPLLDRYLKFSDFSVKLYLDIVLDKEYKQFYRYHCKDKYLDYFFDKFGSLYYENISKKKLLEFISLIVNSYKTNQYITSYNKLHILSPLLYRCLNIEHKRKYENEEEEKEDILEEEINFLNKINFEQIFYFMMESKIYWGRWNKNNLIYQILEKLLTLINKNLITTKMIIENNLFLYRNILELFYKTNSNISLQEIFNLIYSNSSYGNKTLLKFLIENIDMHKNNIDKIIKLLFSKDLYENKKLNIDNDSIAILKYLLNNKYKIDKNFILSEIIKNIKLIKDEHQIFFQETYKIINIFLEYNIDVFDFKDFKKYASLGYIYSGDKKFLDLFSLIINKNIIIGHQFKNYIYEFTHPSNIHQINKKQIRNASKIMNLIDCISTNIPFITYNNHELNPEIEKIIEDNNNEIQKLKIIIKEQYKTIEQNIEELNNLKKQKIKTLDLDLIRLNNELLHLKNNIKYKSNENNIIQDIISQRKLEKKILEKRKEILNNKILEEFYLFFQIYTNNSISAYKIISSNLVEKKFSFIKNQGIETIGEYGTLLVAEILEKLHLPISSIFSEVLKKTIHRLKKTELNNIAQYFTCPNTQSITIEKISLEFTYANKNKILKLFIKELTNWEKIKKIKNIILGNNIKTKIRFFVIQSSEDFIKILKKKKIDKFCISERYNKDDVDIFLNYLNERSKKYLNDNKQIEEKESEEQIALNGDSSFDDQLNSFDEIDFGFIKI